MFNDIADRSILFESVTVRMAPASTVGFAACLRGYDPSTKNVVAMTPLVPLSTTMKTMLSFKAIGNMRAWYNSGETTPPILQIVIYNIQTVTTAVSFAATIQVTGQLAYDELVQQIAPTTVFNDADPAKEAKTSEGGILGFLGKK